MNEDPNLPDEERGMYPKYRAVKIEEDADIDAEITLGASQRPATEVEDPFILLKFNDPNAREALITLANTVEEKYPKFADDIRQLLIKESLDHVRKNLFGNQGKEVARDYEGHPIGEDGLVDGPDGQRLKPVEDPWPAINAQRQAEGTA